MEFYEHEFCVINNDLEDNKSFESVINFFTIIIKNTFDNMNNQCVVSILTNSLDNVKVRIEENEEELGKRIQILKIND